MENRHIMRKHDIRVVTFGNDPWFVAADVCRVLELSNPTVAVSRLDDDERTKLNLGQRGLGAVLM
ncbi:Bro-N domain-containing protein, partial [Terasakiella pusilla]|uniref:BRO-N domain-containing protein n=1 Tax=Terasakiella pusilla TaxID=64973 RepID=UPI003AA8247E